MAIAVSSAGGLVDRPRFRGASHHGAFYVALACIAPLVVAADGAAAVVGASVFAASVAFMFGASALYHRWRWTPAARPWLRRLDHSGVFGLIAGTYTVYGLVALAGPWRWAILGTVWGLALVAVLIRFAWVHAPTWLAAALGVAIGWVGLAAAPFLVSSVGAGGTVLTVLGGLCYTAGAVVYARRRPDPKPRVFGFHEVFHLLVIAAVCLQYSAVAFFLLP